MRTVKISTLVNILKKYDENVYIKDNIIYTKNGNEFILLNTEENIKHFIDILEDSKNVTDIHDKMLIKLLKPEKDWFLNIIFTEEEIKDVLINKLKLTISNDYVEYEKGYYCREIDKMYFPHIVNKCSSGIPSVTSDTNLLTCIIRNFIKENDRYGIFEEYVKPSKKIKGVLE